MNKLNLKCSINQIISGYLERKIHSLHFIQNYMSILDSSQNLSYLLSLFVGNFFSLAKYMFSLNISLGLSTDDAFFAAMPNLGQSDHHDDSPSLLLTLMEQEKKRGPSTTPR